MLALVVAAFAYLCFTVLAPWQLGKNETTQERNDLIEQSMNADPVPVESLLGGSVPAKTDEWRRVTATGTYLPGADVLVRLQSYEGFPAFVVLTPFRLEDGTSVLVNRGYVKADEANRPPPLAAAPTGKLTLEARLRLSQTATGSQQPMFEDGYWQVYAIDLPVIGGIVETPLAPAYIQLAADQPGVFKPVELPQLDSGPYLSYGLQWLAFGIMAPLGLAYFVRAELRERRKITPAAASATAATSATAPAPTPADKMTDRYGKRR